MQGQEAIFSSASVEWGTPQYIFDALDDEFHFTLDAAANPDNTKCRQWYGLQSDGTYVDGLKQDWSGTIWVNPPYSRSDNPRWAKKIYEEACKGTTIVALVAAKTETQHFTDYYAYAHEIRFVKGRVKFIQNGKDNSAPFPSAIVVFRGKPNDKPYQCVKLWEQPK